ncbi:MAG: hypothetical protein ACKOSQ_07260 [Planctomycetaceae bacterium]
MDLHMALAATILAPTVFVLHLILCRVFGSSRAVRWMFTAFVAYLVAFVVAVARRWGLDAPSAQAWITGLAAGGFWSLGYMEAFSMLCRGFSLNVLVQAAGGEATSLEDMMAHYGGVGADALLEKRLASLERLGLIERPSGRIVARGLAAAFISPLTAAYQAAFRMGVGG